MKHNTTIKSLLVALTLAGIALSSCTKSIENGISHELAQMRRTMVSDVHYDMAINVPAELSQAVKGECTISFFLSATADLPIDYTGQPDGTTLNIELNGRCCETMLTNEHIILPKRHLRKGKNIAKIPFISNDNTLNRHADYIYTLFVPANARSVFPCFDQPDLKATFCLKMNVPQGWKTLHSAATKPIPTYLFSFVAGNFFTSTEQRSGRNITAFYRETDQQKVAQLPQVMDMADLAIRWMEEYTGVPYPFDYYNFVVLPGYQFGGMEHPGAIQYNDRRIFLPENATPSEELKRFGLIAHETAHMWFGDLVTMRWFDDVWTKEVFAGFFSDKISRQQFPDLNHDLNHIVGHFPAAFNTDRTAGTHPIQQELDNLNSAGLLYGNIIYHKAPIMMREVEKQMGETALQQALQKYLTKFAYGNATWDELIAIMDASAPEAGIREFDQKWVKTAGIPAPQGAEKLEEMPYTVIPLEKMPSATVVLDNYFQPGAENEVRRMMYAINCFELMEKREGVSPTDSFELFCTLLTKESNTLIASQLVSYLLAIYKESPLESQAELESRLLAVAQEHPLPSVHLQIKRSIYASATNADILSKVEKIWEEQSDKQLSARDYTCIAYHLALMNPSRSENILEKQRERLGTADERSEFDYVSRACTSDTTAQRKLFQSLILPENRINEPWALSAMSLLCDKTREQQACQYIEPALDKLQFIQQSSDIFFPANFLAALLSERKSSQAQEIVDSWIANHPDYPESLMRKIKENSKKAPNRL